MLSVQVFLNDDGSEMELGRGGFGVVLRGTYRMAPVAIKRLKDQSLEQQEVFMREMALLRGCRGSRYIVPFVGASLQPVGLLLTPFKGAPKPCYDSQSRGEHATCPELHGRCIHCSLQDLLSDAVHLGVSTVRHITAAVQAGGSYGASVLQHYGTI